MSRGEPDLVNLLTETVVAELTAQYRQALLTVPTTMALVRGCAPLLDKQIAFDLSVPFGASADLSRRYFQARLFNLLTISSPQTIEIQASPLATKPLREAVTSLLTPTRYGTLASIIERIHHKPLQIKVNDEVFQARSSPNAWNHGPSTPPTQSQTGVALTSKSILARIRNLVLGIDLGGTDIKIAVADASGMILMFEHVWVIQPKDLSEGTHFCEVLKTLSLFALTLATLLRTSGNALLIEQGLRITESNRSSLAAMKTLISEAEAVGLRIEPPDAVGLSFPDVIVSNEVVGGLTSKYQGIRAKYQDSEGGWLNQAGYWQEFSTTIKPLAELLSQGLRELSSNRIPVYITNDGDAGALWAAIESGRPGTIGLSLGTSLAGGKVDHWLRPYSGMFEVGNLIVFIGPEGYTQFNHKNLRIPGCAQQLLSQDTVFRLASVQGLIDGYPHGQEAVMLEHIATTLLEEQPERVQQIFETMGYYLVVTLATLDAAMVPGDLESVVLFGRVVNSSGGKLLVESAKRLLEQGRGGENLRALSLVRASELTPPKTGQSFRVNALAQAIGALYLATLELNDHDRRSLGSG